MQRYWLEIYFDVEGDLQVLRDIGRNRENKWRLVLWLLNEELDPIIESSKILFENGVLSEVQKIANQHAKKLREMGYKIYISGKSPKSKFTIRTSLSLSIRIYRFKLIYTIFSYH